MPSGYVGDFELTQNLQETFNKEALRESAVLILLRVRNDNLYVILTKRADHMRNHPSEWSFPGGKTDDDDKDKVHTALRETDEEIGIQSDRVSIAGQLPDYHIRSGFNVTPIIGVISGDFEYNINKSEVSKVMEVPLIHIGNLENYYMYKTPFEHEIIRLMGLSYNDNDILGSTAGMLMKFTEQIEPQELVRTLKL